MATNVHNFFSSFHLNVALVAFYEISLGPGFNKKISDPLTGSESSNSLPAASLHSATVQFKLQ